MDELVGSAASVALSFLSMGLFGRRNRRTLTEEETEEEQKREWQKVGKLKQIFSHPMQGCYRQETARAFCTPLGIQPLLPGCHLYLLDRCFYIYDPATNEALLNVPKMTAIKISADPKKQTFTFEAPDQPSLLIFAYKTSEEKHIFYCGDTLKMYDCGDDAANWLSMYITGGKNYARIAVSKSLHRRKFSKITDIPKTAQEEKTQHVLSMRPDFSAFSLISQATVEELDSKIPDVTITGEQLRFNFIIEFDPEHNTPYNEDRFEFIKIGKEVEFHDVILCNPSELICVDPDTRAPHKSGEPLKTIKSLRSLKKLSPDVYADFDEPVIGINLDIRSDGTVAVGDDVYVQFRLTR